MSAKINKTEFTNLVNYEIPTTGKQRTISFNEESLYGNDLDAKQKIDELSESDDLIEPIDELAVRAKSNEIRAKHKNRRHTKSEDYPAENPNQFSKALSASLPNHFSFNTSSAVKNWSKKFSKNSRRSRRERGKGMAAKRGQGGKFTWTGDNNLVDVDENGVEDPSDINYDSDKDNCEFVVITPPLSYEEIERHVTAIVSEYYEHCDTNEVAYQLEEYNFNGLNYQIVVIAVTIAMEHKSSHRELTSVLISDLYGRVLKMPEYEQAFKVLIKNLPDLILDTPDAAIVLGNFIARAIADDCLPPCFVTKLKQTLIDPLQLQSIEHAASLLDSRFSMMKLDTIWGISGGMRPVFCLVDRLQLLLDEYISSGDIDEATRCLKELETPHLHHHLIYEGILKALEDMRERTLVLISELFQYLYKTVIVTVDQLTIGFNQVYEEMEDIVVDIPLAYPLLERLVEKCSNFLPRDLVKSCPIQQRGRKRCVSESDGKFKEDLI